MKIKCINKVRHGLGLDFGIEPDYLEIDRTYNVYGLEIEADRIYVYISDFLDSFYPSRYSLQYFEVLSSKMSSHWYFGLKGKAIQFIPKEWIQFPDFMNIYLNNYEPNPELYGNLSSFSEHKKRIDMEEE